MSHPTPVPHCCPAGCFLASVFYATGQKPWWRAPSILCLAPSVTECSPCRWLLKLFAHFWCHYAVLCALLLLSWSIWFPPASGLPLFARAGSRLGMLFLFFDDLLLSSEEQPLCHLPQEPLPDPPESVLLLWVSETILGQFPQSRGTERA